MTHSETKVQIEPTSDLAALLERHRMTQPAVDGSEYTYRLSDTRYSSERYGVCEVCGEHASDVWYQVEGRLFHSRKHGGVQITHHECRNAFGHKTCLESIRR
jgi:hypothetical protein